MAVQVTGGAGYIGSHTVVELLNAGYAVSIVDDLSNAKAEAIDRIEKITRKPLQYYRNNLDSTLTLVETMEAFGCIRC